MHRLKGDFGKVLKTGEKANIVKTTQNYLDLCIVKPVEEISPEFPNSALKNYRK